MDVFLEQTARSAVGFLGSEASQLDRFSAKIVLFTAFAMVVRRDKALHTHRGSALLRSVWPDESAAAASVLTAWLMTGRAVPSWVDERVAETPSITEHMDRETRPRWELHLEPTAKRWAALARLHLEKPFPVPISRAQLRNNKDAFAALRAAIRSAEPRVMRPILKACLTELQQSGQERVAPHVRVEHDVS